MASQSRLAVATRLCLLSCITQVLCHVYGLVPTASGSTSRSVRRCAVLPCHWCMSSPLCMMPAYKEITRSPVCASTTILCTCHGVQRVLLLHTILYSPTSVLSCVLSSALCWVLPWLGAKTGTSCVYRLRLREQGVSSVMGEACRVCDLLHSESSSAKLGRPTTSWQGRPLIVTNTTPVPGCLCLAYTLLLAIHNHSWGFVSVCIHSVWHTLLLARDSTCGLLTQLCCRVCTAIGVSAFAALDQDVQTRDRDLVPVLTCAVLAPDARLLRPFFSVKKGGQSRGYHNLHCARKPLLVV
jgi:hypothetical protein